MVCDMFLSIHSSGGSIQVWGWLLRWRVGNDRTVVQGIGQAGGKAVQPASHHWQRAREMSEQNVLAEAGDENSFLAAPAASSEGLVTESVLQHHGQHPPPFPVLTAPGSGTCTSGNARHDPAQLPRLSLWFNKESCHVRKTHSVEKLT